MITLPDPELAIGRVSDLYRHNVAQLGRDDIVVASHGGSGQSLIGNILFELGLNYVDAYTEVLHDDGRAVAAAAHAAYRRHLASLHDKDKAGDDQPAALWPRFVKTHHVPVVFTEAAILGGVWLLVRDPRDAIYASYQWRASFAEEDWDQVPDTFLDWLRGPGDFTRSPVDDWYAFYVAWTERAQQYDHVDVLRFEDLKQRPVEVVSNALRRLGIEIPTPEARRAVEASSFAKMREHEDRMATSQPRGTAGPRMIRAGKKEGWKDWMTPELAEFFSGAELRAVARQYGYDLADRS
jgi:hypothetical protein